MAEKEEGQADGEQVVTPWEAKAGAGQATIDYEKLISKLNYKGSHCQVI